MMYALLCNGKNKNYDNNDINYGSNYYYHYDVLERFSNLYGNMMMDLIMANNDITAVVILISYNYYYYHCYSYYWHCLFLSCLAVLVVLMKYK